jgi:hypothetical protein
MKTLFILSLGIILSCGARAQFPDHNTYATSAINPFQAKADTVDKIYLKNDAMFTGKVKMIRSDAVEFIDSDTKLSFEFKKSEIKVIILSSGKVLTFADNAEQPKEAAVAPAPSQPAQYYPPPQDSGPGAGVIILAAVGAVLVLLLIIGALASHS